MYRMARTSTICVTIAAGTVALILLTSATMTTSVYAARHHHGHRSIEGGYETYGLNGPPLSDQVNAPPVNDQTNGNGNNPVGNQVNAPPVSASRNDILMRFANVTQPLCAAGICGQSYTNH